MDDFRLIPPNQNYYVYALIDPRNNEIFYVGKGKDIRYKSHINFKGIRNYAFEEKFCKIKEIEDEKLEVKIVKLIDYLLEEEAYELEEILIYNIGRKVFNEGCLTNFRRGGNKSINDNLFYEKPLNTDLLKKYVNRINRDYLNFISKTSKIKYLNDFKFKEVYIYDFDGSSFEKLNLKDFFNHSLNYKLFNFFSINDFPIIYFGKIITLKKINRFYKPKYFCSIQGLYDFNFFEFLELQIKNQHYVRFKYKSFSNYYIHVEGPSFSSSKGMEIRLNIKTYINDDFIDFLSGNIFVSKKIIDENYIQLNLSIEEKKERDSVAAEWEKYKGRLK